MLAAHSGLGDAIVSEQQAAEVDHATIEESVDHEAETFVTNEVILQPDALCTSTTRQTHVRLGFGGARPSTTHRCCGTALGVPTAPSTAR